MILTYKYRIKDKTAKKFLRRHAWGVNQVWNYCNAYQKDIERRHKAGAPKKKWPTFYDFCRLVVGTGRDLGIHQQTVQGVCNQFVQSRNVVKHSLQFRVSKGTRRSLGWIPFESQSRQIEGNSVWYRGKQYRFFGSRRRPLPEIAKGGCFVEDSRGRWYVCFHVEAPKRTCGNGAVGVDLGLSTLATLSDSNKVENPKYFREFENALSCAQRAHNKKRVSAIHAKIKNQRLDFLHKLSAKLVKENSLIVVGDVASDRLSKTVMSKSIKDAGWSMFRAQLQYKCQQAGAVFLNVDEKFTTQTCSVCQARSGPKGIAGLGIREWECSECGTNHDRDVNSARNILALGLSTQPPAEGSSLDRDRCD